MNTPAIQYEVKSRDKKQSLKEQFADPKFIMDTMTSYLREGEFHSMTDLISTYISYSSKYPSQGEFADEIGTSRQTLHRMFAHGNVSMNVFFDALERIHDDIEE